MQILPVLNSQYHYYQVGEEHEYYLPMLILIVASIVLQVNNIHLTLIYHYFGHDITKIVSKKQRKKLGLVKSLTVWLCVQVLNGLAQVLMGPLNLDKEEFKSFLNAVNYISMFLSYGIVGIDAIKAIFFPQTLFSAAKK